MHNAQIILTDKDERIWREVIPNTTLGYPIFVPRIGERVIVEGLVGVVTMVSYDSSDQEVLILAREVGA